MVRLLSARFSLFLNNDGVLDVVMGERACRRDGKHRHADDGGKKGTHDEAPYDYRMDVARGMRGMTPLAHGAPTRRCSAHRQGVIRGSDGAWRAPERVRASPGWSIRLDGGPIDRNHRHRKADRLDHGN